MLTRRPASLVLAVLLSACSHDAPKPVGLEPPAASPEPPARGIPPAAAHTPAGGDSASQALPRGHPPIGAPGAEALPGGPPAAVSSERAIVWVAPTGWVSQPPSSTMRLAQYKVSGPAGDAECAVFYFGPGQGGDALSNAQRWAGQFRLADGKDGQSGLKTRELSVGAIKVLHVEVSGTYVGGMGSEGGEKQGFALLGAIAQGPDANWFFKLTGPEKTIASQRDNFEKMIRSLKKGA